MNLSKNTILVKFELRKLLHIVSIVAITLLFFLVLKSAQKPHLSRSFYFVNAKGKPDSYPGGLKDSIARETKVQDTYRGPITVERLKDALAAYKELSENFGIDGERTWGDEYRFAADVMEQAFSNPGQRNIYIMNMIDAADLEHTYTGRIQQLMDSMQFAKNRIHNSPKVAELARRVTVPFYYGGFDMVWDILRRTLPGIITYCMLLIIMCSSFVFLKETVLSSCIQLSFPAVLGRKNHALVKIQALCIFTTILYFLNVGTYCAILFFRYGAGGGNSAIQIYSFYSLYTGTVMQNIRLYFIIFYFAALFVSLLTFYISLYVKNIITTVIVTSLAFYSGSAIPEGSFLERAVFLFPASALNLRSFFIGRPIVYTLFGKPVLFVYLYIPACIIMSIILAILIVRKFETMEL